MVGVSKLNSELERLGGLVFYVAAVCLLVGAANNAFTYVYDAHGFDVWLGLVLEFGRFAALVGALSLANELTADSRVRTLLRILALGAIAFITFLIAWAIVHHVGAAGRPAAWIALPAYLLSVTTFLAYGIAVLWTSTYSSRIGWFLVVNVIALLLVFFGRAIVPLGLLAAVVPTFQALLYMGIGYDLRLHHAPASRTAVNADTAS